MTTTITGDEVKTIEGDIDRLQGGLTNGQLVNGLIDGDLALDNNGNIILENKDSYANTNETEQISAEWEFGRNTTFYGNINMVGTQGGNTVVGLPDPTSVEEAVNLRYLREYVEKNAHTKAGGEYDPPWTLKTNNAESTGAVMVKIVNRGGAELFSLRNGEGDMRTLNDKMRIDYRPAVDPDPGAQYAFGRTSSGTEYAQGGGVLARDDNNNTTRLI